MSQARQNSVAPDPPGSNDITLDSPTESPRNIIIILWKIIMPQTHLLDVHNTVIEEKMRLLALYRNILHL